MKMNKNHKTVLVILNIIVSFLISSCSSPKEQVRIGNGTFTIEGKDIQLICGEMHYPRIPHEYWRDRLKRASAMGLNTVSAYVFWNFHERQPGGGEASFYRRTAVAWQCQTDPGQRNHGRGTERL